MRVPWLYVLVIGAVECSLIFLPVIGGLFIYGLVALVLLFFSSHLKATTNEHNVLLVLAIVALLRFISFGLPLERIPQILWPVFTGVFGAVALVLLVRRLKLPRKDFGVWARNPASQLLIAGGGWGLGVLQYGLLMSQPLVSVSSPAPLIVWGLLIALFVGVVEELFFRGLLLTLAVRVMGSRALILVGLLSASLAIESHSPINIVFVFCKAVCFAFIVAQTRSVLGVSLAQGFSQATLLLVVPYLAARGDARSSMIATIVAALGGIGAVFAVGSLLVRRLRERAPLADEQPIMQPPALPALADAPGAAMQETQSALAQTLGAAASPRNPSKRVKLRVATVANAQSRGQRHNSNHAGGSLQKHSKNRSKKSASKGERRRKGR